MSSYRIDVIYVAATPSNQLLIEKIADEWRMLADRVDGEARGWATSKAAYWRSVKDTAFKK